LRERNITIGVSVCMYARTHISRTTCPYFTPNFLRVARFSAGYAKKGKVSPYSIVERMVPELLPVLGNQPAGDVSHKPGGRLPFLPARPAVTPATLKRTATSFADWCTEARWA